VVCKNVGVQSLPKEVGWASANGPRRRAGRSRRFCIDVAGSGGTSWSEVEYHRAPTAFHARVARSFADWGIPTAESIQYVRKVRQTAGVPAAVCATHSEHRQIDSVGATPAVWQVRSSKRLRLHRSQ